MEQDQHLNCLVGEGVGGDPLEGEKLGYVGLGEGVALAAFLGEAFLVGGSQGAVTPFQGEAFLGVNKIEGVNAFW